MCGSAEARKGSAVAKQKTKKKAPASRKVKTARGDSAGRAPAAPPKRAKVAKVVQATRQKVSNFAAKPAVTEIVAATLVAAAAALRDPKKARAMAEAAADELESANKEAAGRGAAFWQLALDVARRSVEAAGTPRGTKPAPGNDTKPARKTDKPGKKNKKNKK